jgi:hypothetical protein
VRPRILFTRCPPTLTHNAADPSPSHRVFRPEDSEHLSGLERGGVPMRHRGSTRRSGHKDYGISHTRQVPVDYIC